MGIFKKISSILIVELLVQQYLDMPYSKDTQNIINNLYYSGQYVQRGRQEELKKSYCILYLANQQKFCTGKWKFEIIREI